MTEFANHTGKSIHLLYYPPYHSKYNPVERCWGILEQHWNGTLLKDADTLLEWAKTMTWKGIKPIVEFSHNLLSLSASKLCSLLKQDSKGTLRCLNGTS